MDWYELVEAEWGDPEELQLKAAIGAYLRAKAKARAEEEPNA